jgi:trk system potassium uptake protein
MKKTISGYPLIISYLGIFSILIGIIVMTPMIYILFNFQDAEYALFFAIPGLTSIIIGLLITLFFRNTIKGNLNRNQDSVLVLFVWLFAIFVSSFPFLLTGDYNFTQSIFETTSGYSTTGFTIVNVEQTPNIYLLYRSLLQFFGGVGLILILTSAISDKFGMRLYTAEGHSDKLMPNLIRSARMILSIYIGYIIIGTIFYVFFGMPLFDAINHSISAIATGGFSTKAESIGYYNSVGIEIITIILMILGGTNFFIHLMLIKKKFGTVTKHIELRVLALLTLVFIPIFVLVYRNNMNASIGESIRVSTFHFFSTITTTGLHIIPSVNILPVPILYLSLPLMIIGASVGSTAGGIKLYRFAVASKGAVWNLKDGLQHKKIIHPRYVNRYGFKHFIDKDQLNQIYSFIWIYFFILVFGITIFSLYNNSFYDSVFEFTSILGTIGLSTGLVQYESPNMILWVGIVGMLIARLESIVIIIALSKIYNDLFKRK